MQSHQPQELSEQTRLQIRIGIQGSGILPPEYKSFFAKWMAFNAAYNELAKGRDKHKVLWMGDYLQFHWQKVEPVAKELISLECVGGDKVPMFDILAPQSEVKAATLYLREKLGLDIAPDPTHCTFQACRTEKKQVCNLISCNRTKIDLWRGREMAALFRIVYQVRCNLLHGEKQLSQEGFQGNRDRRLVRISDEIMDQVLDWLIHYP